MLRHLIIAAWRNMAANKLLSVISILGLSVGITAAILMEMVIRSQFTFDNFIPGYERTYLAVSAFTLRDRPMDYVETTSGQLAALFKFNLPEIENVTRLLYTDEDNGGSVELQRGSIAAWETVNWADPNVFDVLPLPVLHGDLATALHRPDGIVLPRAAARKYFGREDIVGQIIMVAGHPMTVRAVIEDLPSNGTELQSGIFASGLAPYSAFATQKVEAPGNMRTIAHTYFRLKPGASIADVERQMPSLVTLYWSQNGLGHNGSYAIQLIRLDRINLFEGLHPGAKAKLAIAGLVGLLILFVASVNFVNLLTARAARRALEVGVRKVSGASRSMLIAQFLGESVLAVLLATCVAMALRELLLPVVNAFLFTDAVFDYRGAPLFLSALLLGVIMLAMVAGAYPAFVLSAFRPASVLKGLAAHPVGAGTIRNALVILQFAILIGLLVAALVVYQQRIYATGEALGVNIDQMLIVRIAHGPCPVTFKAEVRKLPGVRGVSCTGTQFLSDSMAEGFTYRNAVVVFDSVNVDWGAFALYGIKPIAGSLTTLSSHGDYDSSLAPGYVLNQAAVRKLGIASPEAAIGQNLPPKAYSAPRSVVEALGPIPIIAVVPDFSLHSVTQPIQPTIFAGFFGVAAHGGTLVNIKLNGQQIPETLAAIDRLWTATGQARPIDRFFLNDFMQQQYLDILHEAQIFAIFSSIAVFLACLGLVGISISTTERQTKEIGIRKVMGATTGKVVALLLWQFAQPVLWANVIAWPVAWWLMRRWLSGFAYHVDLHWWVFAAASGGALMVALVTVAGQAFLTARQKPVLALRYE